MPVPRLSQSQQVLSILCGIAVSLESCSRSSITKLTIPKLTFTIYNNIIRVDPNFPTTLRIIFVDFFVFVGDVRSLNVTFSVGLTDDHESGVSGTNVE